MWKSILTKIISFIISLISLFIPIHYSVEQPALPIPQTIATTSTTVATSTPKKPVAKAIVKPKTIQKVIAQTPIASTTPSVPIAPKPPEPPLPDYAALNTYTREATVNILCTTGVGSLSPISGSGVIINQDGLIVTNAHIGQYFLLRDFHYKNFVQCVIRTGSPAYPRYHAELVYISPTWIENNKAVITEQEAKGTGEDDFAFLRITDAIDGTALPKFSHLPLNARESIDVGEPVLLVSYPAGFLGGQTILQSLNVTSAITNIQAILTFGTNTIDLISVGGTVVSQKGASGGAVVDKYSSIIGMISLSSDNTETSDRSLYAITPAHINRVLQTEIGMNLAQFTSQDMSAFAQTFQKTTAPLLTKILTDELTKTQ